MTNLWIFGAFLLGCALSVITSTGGPVALGMARRRGFWVGWHAREKYPVGARPRTRAEVARLLTEDEGRVARALAEDESRAERTLAKDESRVESALAKDESRAVRALAEDEET